MAEDLHDGYLNIELPWDMYQKAEMLAEKQSLHIDTVIERALTAFLDKQEKHHAKSYPLPDL